MSEKRKDANNAEQMEILVKRLTFFCTNVWRPVEEVIDGARTGALPWHLCCGSGIIIEIAIGFHWDYRFFAWLHWEWLYPGSLGLLRVYYWTAILSPFWLWGIYRAVLKQRFLTELTRVFADTRLKSGRQLPPKFVFDRRVDAQTRKLRLGRNGISIAEFRKKKDDLEGSLQVYIDDIREDRGKGTVDIIYSPHQMPDVFKPTSFRDLAALHFLVGTTRSKKYTDHLGVTPHLMIAGQTGGGKSTFLRQLITSLYLSNPEMRFTLIDLKGGLEFQIFEGLPRVSVVGNLGGAAYELTQAAIDGEHRMTILKANGCTDLAEYLNLPKEKRKLPEGIPASLALDRRVLVIDEAAELFLVGQGSHTDAVQGARRNLSQIARQGRGLGIHLVVATQRPDSRALDPQVKANLPGVLCFQMVNDASSIGVLGSGRASDLPPIAGRAIWKNSREMIEVQTPLMTKEDAMTLLERYRIKKSSDVPAAEPTTPRIEGATPPLSRKQEFGVEPS